MHAEETFKSRRRSEYNYSFVLFSYCQTFCLVIFAFLVHEFNSIRILLTSWRISVWIRFLVVITWWTAIRPVKAVADQALNVRQVSLILDFDVTSSTQGHPRTNHTSNVLLHQFKTQVSCSSSPLLRTQSISSPIAAWCRSEYSHACFAHCQEFRPCTNLSSHYFSPALQLTQFPVSPGD